METPKIIQVAISPPELVGILAGANRRHVTAMFTDGSRQRLFGFCPDELAVSDTEFIGLTIDEAGELYRAKLSK